MQGLSLYKKGIGGFIIGLAGGTFGGLIGIGGGIIMIPLMTIFAKLTQHRAQGTSLVAIFFTASIGAATYFYHGHVEWESALVLAVSAMATVKWGALYTNSISEKKLKKIFGFFLVFVALMLIVKGLFLESVLQPGTAAKYVVLFVTGIFTGFVVGMMGVGGGSTMIPPLVILAGMPQHLAQGTSLLAMVPISAAGSFNYYRLGNISKEITAGLAPGAAFGGLMGASFASSVPELYLKLFFSVVIIFMGIRYIRT